MPPPTRRKSITGIPKLKRKRLQEQIRRAELHNIITQEQINKRNLARRASRLKSKEADPVTYKRQANHYRKISTLRMQRNTNANVDDDSDIFEIVKPQVIKFGAVENSCRTMSFKDDNVTVISTLNLVPQATCSTFAFLKPYLTAKTLKIGSLSQPIIERNECSVSFLDLFKLLSYKATPNVIFDAHVKSLVDLREGYIPLEYYTHFADPDYSAEPNLTLPKRLLMKDRIIIPLHVIKKGTGHTYLSIYYPNTGEAYVYDTSKGFVTNAVRTNHVQFILNGLYASTGTTTKEFHVINERTPQQTDDTSCAIYIIYVLKFLKRNGYKPSIKIPAATEDDLESIRHNIYSNILPKSELGKKLMKLLIY
ncbi:unnamed protein product [Orchesella dallaii]|uniref:Ubiquitin-like protease family profile domain-containing protein n=1 Tax=Orchesella dallaii TaxID=48710 RepID=A0ABP1PUP1_9HEXA